MEAEGFRRVEISLADIDVFEYTGNHVYDRKQQRSIDWWTVSR